ATFTPTSNSTASGVIQVLSNLFTDSVGNNNLAGVPLILNVDTELPTVTITSNRSSLKFGETASVSFVLSEPSANFDVSDITVSGGSLSGFSGTGTSYTATFTPTSNSTASGVIQVLANKFSDAANNNNTASIPLSLTVDTILPTAAFANVNPSTREGLTQIAITFNESVTGFDTGDIQLTRNGVPVNLQGAILQGTGSSYVLGNLATITYPVGEYALQIKSNGTGIVDGVGNAFSSSNTVTWKMVGTDNTLISIRSPRKDGSMEIRDASTNQSLGTFTPFPGYSGAVHLVEGKFTGDGRRWVVMAAGEGGAPHIVMMDPSTGQVTRSWFGYSTFFRGGLFIGVGDVNGDGADDLVTGPNAGGGPHIKVYDGKTNQVIYEFMAYAPTFTGGVSVSLADVNGDGRLDIVTGTGKGGGPHVIAFDGMSGRQILSFMAYNPAFRGGVFVAAGDIDGDGIAEIVTGTGVGGGPHVGIFDSRTLQMTRGFFAYDSNFRGGVRVGLSDRNGDGVLDILTGPGPGGGPQVNVFDGVTLRLIDSFFAGSPDDLNGVYVN
ncbi:MAG: Ig-like domain-containing protein, partial [Gemmataceae bacterium]